jgi:hypothetical protein
MHYIYSITLTCFKPNVSRASASPWRVSDWKNALQFDYSDFLLNGICRQAIVTDTRMESLSSVRYGKPRWSRWRRKLSQYSSTLPLAWSNFPRALWVYMTLRAVRASCGLSSGSNSNQCHVGGDLYVSRWRLYSQVSNDVAAYLCLAASLRTRDYH